MAVDTLNPNPEATPADVQAPVAGEEGEDVTEDIFGATQTVHSKGPANDAESLKRFDLFTCNFRNVPELFRLALTSAHAKLEETRRTQQNLAQEISRLDNNVRKTQARQVKQLDAFRENLADFERRIVHFERTAGSRRRSRRGPTKTSLSESFQQGPNGPLSPGRGRDSRDPFAGGNSPRRSSNNSNPTSSNNNNPSFGVGITGSSNAPAPMTKAPAVPSVTVRRGSQSSPESPGQAKRQEEEDQGRRGRKEASTKPTGRAGNNKEHAKTANLAAFVGGFVKSSGSAGGSSSNRSSRQSSRASSLTPQEPAKEPLTVPPPQLARHSRAPVLGDVETIFHSDAIDLERLDEDSVDSVVILVSDAEQRLGDRISPLEQGLSETQESLHSTADEVELLRERLGNMAKEVKALHNQLPKQTSEDRIQNISWSWAKNMLPTWLKSIGGLTDGTAEALALALKRAGKMDPEAIISVRADLMKEVEQQAAAVQEVSGRVTALEEEVFLDSRSSGESAESERPRAAEDEDEEDEDEEAELDEEQRLLQETLAAPEKEKEEELQELQDLPTSDPEGSGRVSVVKFALASSDALGGAEEPASQASEDATPPEDSADARPRLEGARSREFLEKSVSSAKENMEGEEERQDLDPDAHESGLARNDATASMEGHEPSSKQDPSDAGEPATATATATANSTSSAAPALSTAADGDAAEPSEKAETPKAAGRKQGDEFAEDAQETLADKQPNEARSQPSASDWKRAKSRSQGRLSSSTLGAAELQESEGPDYKSQASEASPGPPDRSTEDGDDDLLQRTSTTSRASGSRTPRTPRGSRRHFRRSRSRASKADDGSSRHGDRDRPTKFSSENSDQAGPRWPDFMNRQGSDGDDNEEDDARSSGLGPLASTSSSPRRRGGPLAPSLFLSEDILGRRYSSEDQASTPGPAPLSLFGVVSDVMGSDAHRSDEGSRTPSKRRGLASTAPFGDARAGSKTPRKMMGSGAVTTPGSHRRGLGSFSGTMMTPLGQDTRQRKGVHHFEQAIAGHEEVLTEMKKEHESFKKTIADLESHAGVNSDEYQAELKRVENDILSQIHGNLRVFGEKVATMEEKVGRCLKSFEDYQGQVSTKLAKGKTEVDGMTAELRSLAEMTSNSVSEVLKSLEEERGRYAEQLGIIFPRALEDKERKGQMSITEARMFGLDSRLDALEKRVWQGTRTSLQSVDPAALDERQLLKRGQKSRLKSTATTVKAVCNLNAHTPGTRKGYKDGVPFSLDRLELKDGEILTSKGAQEALSQAREAMTLLKGGASREPDESLSGSDSDRQGLAGPTARAGSKGGIGWMLKQGQGMIASALALPPALEEPDQEELAGGESRSTALAIQADLALGGETASTQSLVPSRVRLPTRQIREDSPVTLPTPAVPSTLTTSRLGNQQAQLPEFPLSVCGRNGSGRRPASSGSTRQRPKAAATPRPQTTGAAAPTPSSTAPSARESTRATAAAPVEEAAASKASASASVSLPKAGSGAPPPSATPATPSEAPAPVPVPAAQAPTSASRASGSAASTSSTGPTASPATGSATSRPHPKATANTALSTHEVQSRLAKGCPSAWHAV